MKRMSRIGCVCCGMIQGSMVCFDCRKKINRLLYRGWEPENIVTIMMRARLVQTTLDSYLDL